MRFITQALDYLGLDRWLAVVIVEMWEINSSYAVRERPALFLEADLNFSRTVSRNDGRRAGLKNTLSGRDVCNYGCNNFIFTVTVVKFG